jgi:hypothetical protein
VELRAAVEQLVDQRTRNKCLVRGPVAAVDFEANCFAPNSLARILTSDPTFNVLIALRDYAAALLLVETEEIALLSPPPVMLSAPTASRFDVAVLFNF